MASFDSIDHFGVGYDRHVIVRHDTCKRRRDGSPAPSEITLSKSLSDQDLITTSPYSLTPNPPWCLASRPFSSPSARSTDIVPEDIFVVITDGPGHMSPPSLDKSILFRDIEWVHDELTPINRYLRCHERHEYISVSHATNTPCQQPYQDYLPCPGSPVSVAVSLAIEHKIQPGLFDIPAPDSVPAMTSVQTATPPQPQPAAETVPPFTPVDEAPIMIRRYLDDLQEPNWLSVVLEQPSQSADGAERERHTPSQEPPNDTRLSTELSPNQESVPCVAVSSGKRGLPDWEIDSEPESNDMIVPGHEDEVAMISEAVKDRKNAIAASRPRAHRLQRVHKKRKAKVSKDGSTSPVSAFRTMEADDKPRQVGPYQ